MPGSLHSFITSWRLLLFCAVIYLVPFFVFSFWNHLSVDDYFIGVKKQELNFWDIQSFYYSTWSGRYVSIFSASILVFSNLLYTKTDWLGIYFLSATVLSGFYCLSQISRLMLKHAVHGFYLLALALVLTIAELNMIPQPVTQFYWFSGAVTYQQPLVFLLLLTGTFTGLLFSSRHRTIYLTATVLLLLCMHGYNEMITIWFLVYSTLIAGLHYLTSVKFSRVIVILMACNYLFAAVLLFAPGNFIRASFFESSPVAVILAMSSVKFVILNWFFLKEPLWWFLLMVLASNTPLQQQVLKYPLLAYLRKMHLLKLLFIYVLCGLLTYFPVLYVSNGSIPYRMENAVCFLNSLVLLILLFIKLPALRLAGFTEMYKYRFVFLSLGIFLSANMQEVAQTAISGFFYDKVMDKRLTALIAAGNRNQSRVVLDDYDTAVSKVVERYFPNGTRKTFRDIMVQKPSLLFFTDDLEYKANRVLLQRFYGIDTIEVIRQHPVAR